MKVDQIFTILVRTFGIKTCTHSTLIKQKYVGISLIDIIDWIAPRMLNQRQEGKPSRLRCHLGMIN